MRTIIRIDHVESRTDTKNKTYWRTHATLDDGTEAIGFGKDFDLKDKVEAFFDEKWGVIKMRKPNE